MEVELWHCRIVELRHCDIVELWHCRIYEFLHKLKQRVDVHVLFSMFLKTTIVLNIAVTAGICYTKEHRHSTVAAKEGRPPVKSALPPLPFDTLVTGMPRLAWTWRWDDVSPVFDFQKESSCCKFLRLLCDLLNKVLLQPALALVCQVSWKFFIVS